MQQVEAGTPKRSNSSNIEGRVALYLVAVVATAIIAVVIAILAKALDTILLVPIVAVVFLACSIGVIEWALRSKNKELSSRATAPVAGQPELAAVAETSALFASGLSLQNSMEKSLAGLPIPNDLTAMIGVLDTGRTQLTILAAKGPLRDAVIGRQIRGTDLPPQKWQDALLQNQVQGIADLRMAAPLQYDQMVASTPELAAAKAVVIYPLVANNQCLGYLAIAKAASFTLPEPINQMLSIYVRQAATAVANAQPATTPVKQAPILAPVLDAIQEPIFWVDNNQIITGANRAFADLVGADPASLVGQRCSDIIPSCGGINGACPAIDANSAFSPPADPPVVSLAWKDFQIESGCIYDGQGSQNGIAHTLKAIIKTEPEPMVMAPEPRPSPQPARSPLVDHILEAASLDVPLPQQLEYAIDKIIQDLGAEGGWAYLAPSGDPAGQSALMARAISTAKAENIAASWNELFDNNPAKTFIISDLSIWYDPGASELVSDGWRAAALMALSTKSGVIGNVGILSHNRDGWEADLEADMDRAAALLSLLAQQSASIETPAITPDATPPASPEPEAAGHLPASASIDEAIGVVLEAAANIYTSPTATVSVFMLDPEKEAYVEERSIGPDSSGVRGIEAPIIGVPPELAKVLFADGEVAQSWASPELAESGSSISWMHSFRPWLIAPLRWREHTVALISVVDPVGRINDEGPAEELSALLPEMGSVLGAFLPIAAEEQAIPVQPRHEVLYIVSHELRTPLASLKAAIELLDEINQTATPSEYQTRLLDNAKRSISRLDRLVSDLADVSSLSNDTLRLDIEKSSAQDLIAEAIGVMIPLAQTKQQTMEIDIPDQLPDVFVDRYRMGQILGNLLFNAHKFGQENGRLGLRVWYDRIEGVIFQVSDDGPGMTAAELKRVFEPFQPTGEEVARRAISGGLGLMIAKSLVERHGGRLWATSEPNSGSQFYFSVPVKAGNAV